MHLISENPWIEVKYTNKNYDMAKKKIQRQEPRKKKIFFLKEK